MRTHQFLLASTAFYGSRGAPHKWGRYPDTFLSLSSFLGERLLVGANCLGTWTAYVDRESTLDQQQGSAAIQEPMRKHQNERFLK